MIRQVPVTISSKEPNTSIEEVAFVRGFQNYSVVVRGPWRLIRCTDSVELKVVLIGPYSVMPDLTGYQILTAAGFSSVDAALALGAKHYEVKTWQKQQRARVKAAKAQPRMGSTTALDDLKGK